MSFHWDSVNIPSFLFAAKVSKYLWGLLVFAGLLGILYWILRSIGIDRNTPPSMIWRKVLAFARSFYRPIFLKGRWKKAAQCEESQKWDAAVEMYVQLFDYDGLLSSRANIAIHNDRCLEHVEDICKRVGYPYPADRINRLREDIYDYFLVKMKYLAPSDYDGSALIRAENEHRFFDKLNLRQEEQFIEDFREFFESFAAKLKHHILSGAPPVVTPVIPKPASAGESVEISNISLHDNMDSRDSQWAEEHTGSDLAIPQEAKPSMLAPAPSIFGGGRVEEAPLPPPPDLFAGSRGGFTAEPNPFSLDDPRVPHLDATGRLHKLPGAGEDRAFQANPQESRKSSPPISDTARLGLSSPPSSSASAAFPQPTGGFPGFAAGPAAPIASPQPTGNFPGFGGNVTAPAAQAVQVAPKAPVAPQPTGNFPGLGIGATPFASTPMAPITPQPTGGFPGFANAPSVGPGTPSPAPSFPQPTGGFPGFGTGSPAPAPNFPQPTGGFPGLGQGKPPQTPSPSAINFPQSTGGFPGFGGNPVSPVASTIPQPTGGFPGFGQSGGTSPLSGVPVAPQPTGGFPGFSAPANARPALGNAPKDGKK